MEGKDYIVRASAAGSTVRAFAITARGLVQQASSCHHTSPVISAALGRLLAAGAMMGVMMKGEDDLLTIQVSGSGPVKGLTVTADSAGHVKGYAQAPQVGLPANAQGKLDVGGAVGQGILRVIKDMGLKEPYVGTVPLQTGEIAEDLTYYFASSEQVPSSVGLGVLVDKDWSIRQAGGFLIQLMPQAGDGVIEKLEANISGIRPVADMLEQGFSPEMILETVLDGLGLEIKEKVQASFTCNCSKERVQKALASTRKKTSKAWLTTKSRLRLDASFAIQHTSFAKKNCVNCLRRWGEYGQTKKGQPCYYSQPICS